MKSFLTDFIRNMDIERNKLLKILNERLLFDPFNVNDEELLSIVSNYDYALTHSYHMMLIKYGLSYEVPESSLFPSHRRINLTYSNKIRSRNLKDYSLIITTENGEKIGNKIIDPYSTNNLVFLSNAANPELYLEDTFFFLIHSTEGKNKYGKKKYAWTLVDMHRCGNTYQKAAVVREYYIKAQIWAYRELISNPLKFGIFMTSEEVNKVVSPYINKNKNLLKTKKDSFVQLDD